jgi:CubicO group peptidase (beta-lactamase class C family)
MSRMKLTKVVVVACVLGLLVSCSSTSSDESSATRSATRNAGPSADPALAEVVTKLVQSQMTERHLRSVIVRVTVDGKEIVTRAFGESMTGVPATTDMHFRNGAVAISYVSTLLLMLVDEKTVSLDDKVSKWLPEIPHSDEVTLGQLAQMTSGYVDYVIGNEEVDAQLYTDPFRQWTPEELIATVSSKPLLYPPGTNWNYAHTN